MAVEEQTQVTQKLITCTDNDVVNDALKQRKNKSAVLLRRELEKRGKTGSRYFLLTVRQLRTRSCPSPHDGLLKTTQDKVESFSPCFLAASHNLRNINELTSELT